MKRLIIFICILSLLLCSACKPQGQPSQEIEQNPAASRQPTVIDPDLKAPEPPSPDIQEPVLTPQQPTRTVKELSAEYAGKEIGYVAHEDFAAAATDFSLRMIEKCPDEQDNLLLSPLSALFALAMAEHGAKGETKAQIQKALLGQYQDLSLQHSLAAYRQQYEGDSPIKIANSLWLREDDLVVEKDYLQRNADYFAAQIYTSPFDSTLVNDINGWVKLHTGGMIDKILEKPPAEDVMMYLINTLFFEDSWRDPFGDHQIKEGTFTAADGSKQKVTNLCSTEDFYLEGKNCTGFKKYYQNGDCFVALLPKKGITPRQLLDSLDGAAFAQLLRPLEDSWVRITLPKYKTDYTITLNDTLKTMGITHAFDGSMANFSAMGHSAQGYPLYISTVLQKTAFELDEKGTKAAAVTEIGMKAASAPQAPPNIYTVTLDRPFVYAIVDKNNTPLFIGIMNSVK